MSTIDDAFDMEGVASDLPIDQYPNWNGEVYGICRTRGCPQEGRIGFYAGGFCKICSPRHRDDLKRYTSDIEVRWLEDKKRYVQDLSQNLSGSERRRFYMTPEELIQLQDTVDYEEPYDLDEDAFAPTDEDKIRRGEWG